MLCGSPSAGEWPRGEPRALRPRRGAGVCSPEELGENQEAAAGGGGDFLVYFSL